MTSKLARASSEGMDPDEAQTHSRKRTRMERSQGTLKASPAKRLAA